MEHIQGAVVNEFNLRIKWRTSLLRISWGVGILNMWFQSTALRIASSKWIFLEIWICVDFISRANIADPISAQSRQFPHLLLFNNRSKHALPDTRNRPQTFAKISSPNCGREEFNDWINILKKQKNDKYPLYLDIQLMRIGTCSVEQH